MEYMINYVKDKKLFFSIFVLPSVISFVYFAIIASHQYVSEAPVMVYKGGSGSNAQTVNLTGSGMSLEGVVLVREHMRSWEAFSKLNAAKLETGWSQGDFVSRYGGLLNLFRRSPTRLWQYYRSHVEPIVDEDNGILTLQVTGYDPQFVKDVADSVLANSSSAINHIKDDSLNNSVAWMQADLDREKERLNAAIARYSALKRVNGIADPSAAYSSRLEQLNEVNGKIANLSSQISAVQASVPNSEQLANLVSERRGLSAKARDADVEVKKLVRIVGDIDAAQNEIRVSEAKVATAQAQLTAARQEALNNRYFVAVISPPNKPVEATEPARVFWILVVMVVSFVIYLIVK